jgi:hypothetical protein
MSLMSGLTDFVTGGENKKAEEDLAGLMAQIQGIATPTADQLQLGPLEQYANAGDLAPALAEAAQTGPSAFGNENLSEVPFETMQKVLAQEDQIASSNGMTPQERAAIAQAEDSMNRSVAGQRGAIAADFAQRGIPASLISAALENGAVGQDSQQGYMNALNAEANAANNATAARTAEGSLAGQMYGQQAGQQNTVAEAQNALSQFNAANRQQTGLANQANKQAANTYNATTGQNISDKNVSGENQRRVQNQVEAPQEAASLALQKGQELAGVGEAQAGQHTAAGQQAAGIFGGILGAGASLGASAMAPAPVTNIAVGGGVPLAEGGEIPRPTVPPVNFLAGGAVPGRATVPGDDRRNDTVPARLSPGEFVVPRSAMARPDVRSFLAQNVPTPRPPSPHPSDIAQIIKALAVLRGGQEVA